MGTLFLSFSIAIGSAIGLVALSRSFDLETYTTRVFPLIPILYAIVYQALEHRRTGKAKPIPPAKAKEEMKAGAKKLFENITADRIFMAIGISIGIKIAFEVFYAVLFVKFSGQTFADIYGKFGIETVARFVRGDHPWLSGEEGFTLLALVAVVSSFGTGLWIGYTSRGRAILEGVLVGTAVTLISAVTNMVILYRKIEQVAEAMAAQMGLAAHIGFVAVLTVQVMLYGLWSGISEKAKQERVVRLEARRSGRKKK